MCISLGIGWRNGGSLDVKDGLCIYGMVDWIAAFEQVRYWNTTAAAATPRDRNSDSELRGRLQETRLIRWYSHYSFKVGETFSVTAVTALIRLMISLRKSIVIALSEIQSLEEIVDM